VLNASGEQKEAEAIALPKTAAAKPAPAKAALDQAALDMLTKAVIASAEEDGRANLARVGTHLAKQSPDFDARNYGFPRLLDLVEESGIVEVERFGENPKLNDPRLEGEGFGGSRPRSTSRMEATAAVRFRHPPHVPRHGNETGLCAGYAAKLNSVAASAPPPPAWWARVGVAEAAVAPGISSFLSVMFDPRSIQQKRSDLSHFSVPRPTAIPLKKSGARRRLSSHSKFGHLPLLRRRQACRTSSR
jgi:hypothetical protein